MQSEPHALWFTGILTLFVAAVAFAEGPTNEPTVRLKQLSIEELMAVEVSTVTTASRREESLLEAPGTVIVIDRRQIERRGYVTLVDVLRDLPGIDLIPYYFSEIGTQVAIRGINGNNKVVILVNGMRVNPPGGEYYPLRTDFSVRQAEQVEIIYGPGSTLYGQDAIAAVINIITRTPEAPQGEVSVAGGPNDTRQAWGTLSGAFGPEGAFRVLAHAYYFHSELTDLAHEYPDWWAPYRAVAAPKGTTGAPTRWDDGLNVVLRVESEESSLQWFQRVSERSSSEGFSTILGYVPEARWEDMSTVIEAKNSLPVADQVRLESALTYSRYEIDPDSRYVFPSGDTQWFYDDYKYGIGSGASIEETVRMEVTPSLNVLAGGMASSYEITPKSTVPGRANPEEDVSAQAGEFVYYTEAGNPATRQEVPRSVTRSYETYAGYVESAWQALDRWKVIGGVRSTYDTRFDDTPLTPRFSLIHSLSEILTAKYTYTRAYVAPAPYFSNAPYDNGTVLSIPNPDLEPEKAESHELNLNVVTHWGNGGISAYTGNQENRILVADTLAPPTIVIDQVYMQDGSTRVLGHTVNSGNSENRGFDIYGELHLGPVSPWFSYSRIWFDRESGWAADGLPSLSTQLGRLGATWAATERLLITPSFYIRSRPENVTAGELDHELETPWDLNLHVQYRLNDYVDLYTTIYNVTDHHYALGGITGDAVPQETIHGMAGMKARF
jgi:outer membrane receptor protein involved in Fe transport